MSAFRYIFMFCILCLCLCCKTDPEVKPAEVLKNQKVHLLIFKKEQLLELWLSDSLKRNKSATYTIRSADLPIGQFPISIQSNQLQPNFKSNKLLRKHIVETKNIDPDSPFDLLSLLSIENAKQARSIFQNQQLNDVLIFPNDGRSNKGFNPCMNCPIWMPELYGGLEMALVGFR